MRIFAHSWRTSSNLLCDYRMPTPSGLFVLWFTRDPLYYLATIHSFLLHNVPFCEALLGNTREYRLKKVDEVG